MGRRKDREKKRRQEELDSGDHDSRKQTRLGIEYRGRGHDVMKKDTWNHHAAAAAAAECLWAPQGRGLLGQSGGGRVFPFDSEDEGESDGQGVTLKQEECDDEGHYDTTAVPSSSVEHDIDEDEEREAEVAEQSNDDGAEQDEAEDEVQLVLEPHDHADSDVEEDAEEEEFETRVNDEGMIEHEEEDEERQEEAEVAGQSNDDGEEEEPEEEFQLVLEPHDHADADMEEDAEEEEFETRVNDEGMQEESEEVAESSVEPANDEGTGLNQVATSALEHDGAAEQEESVLESQREIPQKMLLDSHSLEQLTKAIAHGDVGMFKEIMSMVPDVNIYDQVGMTPLMYSCYTGHEYIVECLIEEGAQVQVNDERGKTPLIVAVEMGHVHLIDILLTAGADANAVCLEGKSPLVYALLAKREDIAAKLIRSGANMNCVVRKLGVTPFVLAATTGLTTTAKVMLDCGADIGVGDEHGRNALMMCILKKCKSKDMIRSLIRQSTRKQIESVDRDGASVLDYAVGNSMPFAVEKLLEAGCDVESRKSKGRPLLRAVEMGNRDIVCALLCYGANPNIEDDKGRTPLMYACLRGFGEIVSHLLDAGADSNVSDPEGGYTPLHVSAYYGHIDSCRAIMRQQGVQISL